MAEEIDNLINSYKGAGAKKIEKEFPPFIIFENEGQYVSGIITNFHKIRGKMGMQDIADIGVIKTNIPSVTVGKKHSLTISKALENLFEYPDSEVLVIYRGKKPLGNGREFRDYEVFVKGV